MIGIDRIIRDRKTRLWIYGITTAALYLLGTYGILSGEQIASWALLAGAVTNLAAVNVPSPVDAPDAYPAEHAGE